MRFQIIGPDGAVFELSDPEYFLDEYEPRGFAIVTDPPAGHDVPDLREARAKRKAAAREAKEKTDKTTTTTTTTPRPTTTTSTTTMTPAPDQT